MDVWPCEKAHKLLLQNSIMYRSSDISSCSVDEKYNSSSGMQTNIWGPAMWMSLHIVSFNYPVNPTKHQQQTYASWLVHTGQILPCKYCRENFEKNMTAAGWQWTDHATNLDVVMKNRNTFSFFVWKLHDNVNQMLQKQSPPFEEVRNMFESMRASCLTDDEKIKLEFESKELGCVRPLHKGKRGKCVISIVPSDQTQINSLKIDEQCMPK